MNPQAFNRFSYVGNNPIRFRDPTGHCRIDDDADECFRPGFNNPPSFDDQLRDFGVTVDQRMGRRERRAILEAVILVGERLADVTAEGETASEAFRAVYADGMNFSLGGTNASGQCASDTITAGGCTSSQNQINFWTMSGHNMYGDAASDSYDFTRMVKNVVHELGHAYIWAYEHATGINPLHHMGTLNTNRALFLRPNCVYPCSGPEYLEPEYYDWQQHPPAMDELGWTPSETFGDMFIAWTYNAWNTSPENAIQVEAAQAWMNNWVP